jgi:hypothetical protein
LDTLFVDFGPERNRSFRKLSNWALGVENERIEYDPNRFAKLVFSGHMGCGKSVELAKYAEKINHRDAYFVVFIDLEIETPIENIEAEDILVAMVSVLVKKLTEKKIKFEKDDFAEIANELLSEKEELKEVTKEYGLQAEGKASVGWSFWKFLGIDGNLKGAYARNNKTTQIVRKAIKTNAKPILNKLNTALNALRIGLQNQGIGKDILFVIDGLEKANKEVYESLFVKDIQLITGIEAHIISTVPIRTYYEIQYLGTKDAFRTTYLPMLRLNSSSISLLKSLVFKRVDQGLFGKGVISKLIDMCGGCPRILLKLVNLSIIEAEGKQVSIANAKRVLNAEGLERWKALTQRHREILKSGHFNAADPEVLDLLQSLSILEYNGDTIDRKVNPLIAPFLAAMP